MLVFCVHCQQKQSVKNRFVKKTRTGKYTVKGICNECGGKVSSMISKKVYDQELKKSFEPPTYI